MGGLFVALGASGLLDRVAKVFPHPVIRGVQLSVGLLFCQLAWKLVTAPPAAFADHAQPIAWLIASAGIVIIAALFLRRYNVSLIFVVLAVVAMTFAFHGSLTLGPAALHFPQLSLEAFSTAAIALVLPQLPLTFANSCLATADVARTYFGAAAERVRPGRLALSLGVANLLAGSICGMPVCHGAGGMTAHRTFGARTGGAPIVLGVALVVIGLVIGKDLAAVLSGFPLAVLAGLLAVAGLLHIALLKDLNEPAHWMLAIGVGVAGFLTNLAVALTAALLIWWIARAVLMLRGRHDG